MGNGEYDPNKEVLLRQAYSRANLETMTVTVQVQNSRLGSAVHGHKLQLGHDYCGFLRIICLPSYQL